MSQEQTNEWKTYFRFDEVFGWIFANAFILFTAIILVLRALETPGSYTALRIIGYSAGTLIALWYVNFTKHKRMSPRVHKWVYGTLTVVTILSFLLLLMVE